MPPGQYQNPYQQSQQPEQNPYGFFMEDNNSGHKFPGFNGDWSIKKIVLVAAVTLAVLMTLLVIGKALFGGSSNAEPLVVVAQRQQEMARITTEAFEIAKDGETKNFAYTANLSVTSSQQELISFLAENGVGIGEEQIALLHSPQTDAALSAAEEASTYDSTFLEVMKSQLENYASSVKTAYSAGTNPETRQILSDEYDQSQLLLKQLATVH